VLTIEESFTNYHGAIFRSKIVDLFILNWRANLRDGEILFSFCKLCDPVTLQIFVIADVILRRELWVRLRVHALRLVTTVSRRLKCRIR
jgi:hypothetical protein